MVLAIVLGVMLAVMRLSPNPVLKWVGWLYLWFFRGHPGVRAVGVLGPDSADLPEHRPGRPVRHRFVAPRTCRSCQLPFLLAVIGLALNEAAYMAEIVRAGIARWTRARRRPRPRWACRGRMAMRRIVLPQAMRVIIPPTGNEMISMLKTTSLVTAVPFTAGPVRCRPGHVARDLQPVPMLMVASTWYLVFTCVLMVGQYYLERYFSRGASRKLTTKQLEALAKAQDRRRCDVTATR